MKLLFEVRCISCVAILIVHGISVPYMQSILIIYFMVSYYYKLVPRGAQQLGPYIALARSCLGLFSLIVLTFLFYIFHTTL